MATKGQIWVISLKIKRSEDDRTGRILCTLHKLKLSMNGVLITNYGSIMDPTVGLKAALP